MLQSRRGLRADGICGPQTWNALVEAGWQLGDRFLYLTQPMLRGDDVAAVQRRLGSLGFDAGRVDGIFGPQTETAVRDFQRNAGLVVDGNCGPATVIALARLGQRCGGAEPVVGVRERELLRRGPQSLAGRRVVIGHDGSLDALASTLGRAATAAGATAVVLTHADGSKLAVEANALAADVYLGLSVAQDPVCRAAFYAHPGGWESPAGRRLASLCQKLALGVLGDSEDAGTAGLSIPVLRETRMPAVLCELGPAGAVVEATPRLVGALTQALADWSAIDDEL